MAGKPLIGIGMNRCFREQELWMLDAGAFIHAIEWAARTTATVVGKPSAPFLRGTGGIYGLFGVRVPDGGRRRGS
jgi:ribonucleotide monophosphatase NagD (HAD superfamily)